MDPKASPERAGGGTLGVARVDGASAVVSSRADAPLKLLVPRPRGPAAWIYAATLGGGLLPGDSIDLDLDLAPAAAALVATQSSTKIYPSDGRPSVQTLRARLADGAFLAWLPDPLCPFAGAIYRQHQRIDLSPGASLALVDAIVSGRAARAERWQFTSLHCTTEIFVDGRLTIRDALHLEDDADLSVADRMGRFDALATVLLLGPALAEAAAGLVERFAATPLRAEPRQLASLHTAVNPVAGGALLRIAGERIEEVTAAVRSALQVLTPLLGEDPWARRW
ncbi:urease accessory protein UreD [Chondromyces crocatus]|uniref:Urease accessory protein UreD n=1 Tax=Chondromyces crocatus TaxID=52 RepID=A0A0K1ECS3_CHOCO|nr:urease accessory protein UreD [Chondromyces crocatus]AKT38639.1 urease accessory protein UreD [Chondromyces crocatus]